MTGIDYPSATPDIAGTGRMELSYYDNGLLRTASQHAYSPNPRSDWTYDYNSEGLLTSETLAIDGKQFTLGYDYGDIKQQTSVTYPSGRTVAMSHNGRGQATDIAGFVESAGYHPNGQLAHASFSNGTDLSVTQDPQLRPENLSVSGSADSNVSSLLDFQYAYDDRGNVTEITNYFPTENTTAKRSLNSLSYDGLGRLSSATVRGEDVDFSYDALGNINEKEWEDGDRLIYSYNYGTGNLVSANSTNNFRAPDYSMSYDGNGNVIGTGSSSFLYDHANRLVKSTVGSSVQTNTYDANNMRVIAVQNYSHGERTYYVYAQDGQLLHELDDHTGETRDHIYLDGKQIATVGKHDQRDSDADGIPDYFERLHGLNPSLTSDGAHDSDGDGRSNLTEYLYGALPTNTDSDGDGVSDSTDPDFVYIPGLEKPGGVSLGPVFDFVSQ